MSWVRIDDGFADHPKIVGLTPQARDLFIWGLCYCGRQLTDGFVAHGVVHGCVLVATRYARVKACAALVLAGLWIEVEGGYQVHDYLDYNPDAASVREERRRAAERQTRWRERQKQRRNGVTRGVTRKGHNAPPDPAPKGAGREAPPLEGAPPPDETPVFEANGQPCIVCERTGLPVVMHAGQWWCEPCLADYDRPGGRIELGQVEPRASLAGEESAA
jgi:hypothetical protein